MNFLNRTPFLFILLLALFSASCVNTKKVIYFNNIQDTVLQNPSADYEAVIQKNDLLSVSVSSLNPEASSMFNIQNQAVASPALTTSAAGAPVTGSSVGTTGGAQQMGYLVSDDGSIKFPVIGNVQAAGLTKKQLEKSIAATLTEKKLLIDPIVGVRFLNFRVTVIGEVARPTTINVANERISILEAIGLAGDLTIYGKRDNVLLIREEGNKKVVKRMDLTSKGVLASPYYYLKTNDVVYVEPNNARIATTSRTQQLLPIVLSALSFIAVIVAYSFRN